MKQFRARNRQVVKLQRRTRSIAPEKTAMSPGVDRSNENDCEKSDAKRISKITAGELLFAKFGSERSLFCSGTMSSELEMQVQPSPQLDFEVSESDGASQLFLASAGEQHERTGATFWQHLQLFSHDEQPCDELELPDLLEQHFAVPDEALH